jgi:hypothetical protein
MASSLSPGRRTSVVLLLGCAALLAAGAAQATGQTPRRGFVPAGVAEPDEGMFLAELEGRLDALADRPGATHELLRNEARRLVARYAHAWREAAQASAELTPDADPKAEPRHRTVQGRIERRLLRLALQGVKAREERVLQKNIEERAERRRSGAPPPVQRITAATGGISGNVSGPSGPMDSIELDLYDASGYYLAYTLTDGSGNYAFAGLGTGSYYVSTWNWTGLINEAWDNVPCPGSSPKSCGGTAISVTDGTVTPGINFVLAAGGRISGKVKASATGAVIQSVEVDVYDSTGEWAGYGWTGADGSYLTFGGLPSGTYFVLAYGRVQGYVDEAYDNVRCAPCTITSATPVAVTAPATKTNINFSLDRAGAISGQVTDSVTGLPLSAVPVLAYTSSGSYFSYAQTAANGTYTLKGFVTGSYFVRTSNSLGYVNEVYNNHPCPGYCSVTTGDPVAVTEGATKTGIDFALDPGATVSGTVRDALTSLPLAEVEIDLYSSTESYAGYAISAAGGTYSIGGLTAGTYYARTYNSVGYLDELYRERPCVVYCDVTNGDPIVVAPGATVTGIDFTLSQGGRISGHVTSTTGTPLAGVTVSVYGQDGAPFGDGVTDASGAYTVGGLATDSYLAATSASGAGLDYVDEIYEDVPCPQCGEYYYYLYEPNLATPIPVTQGATSSVDFALAPGGSITGNVTNASSGAPITAVVDLYDRAGTYLRYTEVAGAYSFPGLPTGTYYVTAAGRQGEMAELYDDVRVAPGVSMSRGTPVAVTAGTPTSGIDFALSPGGRIAGRVTLAATGAALADAEVDIYGEAGSYLGYAETDASGHYTTREGLPTGKYFAYLSWFYPSSQNLSRQLYKGIDCLSTSVDCAILSGDPIDVMAPATKTGVDFALNTGGSVSGTVADAATGLAAAGAYVVVYAVSGTGPYSGKSASTSSTGAYTISGLPSGGYYVLARGGDYVPELYHDVPCLGCALTTGNKVTVKAGATTTGINFALAKGGTVRGTVKSGASGLGLAATVIARGASGAQLSSATADAGSGAYAIGGLPSGTYYLTTSNSMGYLDELYDDLPCPHSICNPVAGTGVAVAAGSTASGIDFALSAGGTISGFVHDDAGAGVASGYVSVYGSGGQTAGSSMVAANGFYRVGGLAAGSHYIVATGYGGLVSEVYDDVPCLGCDPVASGTPVPLSTGGLASGIDFTLAPGGGFSGTVTDASGAPLRATIRGYNGTGGYIGSTSSDATGYYRNSVGLPPGTYFALAYASGMDQQLYDGITCAACDPTTGTPITVTGLATTSGIDFHLASVSRSFYTVSPCRLLDTRNPAGALGGPALAANADRSFAVGGTCGIPLDAQALSVNVTSTGSTAVGHLRLHAGRTRIPATSSLNYALGQTRANNAIVPVNGVGELAVYCGQAAGATHVIVDVNGYFK